jgi:hypothetical protein
VGVRLSVALQRVRGAITIREGSCTSPKLIGENRIEVVMNAMQRILPATGVALRIGKADEVVASCQPAFERVEVVYLFGRGILRFSNLPE